MDEKLVLRFLRSETSLGGNDFHTSPDAFFELYQKMAHTDMKKDRFRILLEGYKQTISRGPYPEDPENLTIGRVYFVPIPEPSVSEMIFWTLRSLEMLAAARLWRCLEFSPCQLQYGRIKGPQGCSLVYDQEKLYIESASGNKIIDDPLTNPVFSFIKKVNPWNHLSSNYQVVYPFLAEAEELKFDIISLREDLESGKQFSIKGVFVDFIREYQKIQGMYRVLLGEPTWDDYHTEISVLKDNLLEIIYHCPGMPGYSESEKTFDERKSS